MNFAAAAGFVKAVPQHLWKCIRKTLSASLIPFCPINFIRIWGYRLVGFKIGKRVFIGMHCYLDDTAPHRMVIEDDAVVSYRVTFACHGPRSENNMLFLRRGCYIGTASTVLGGQASGDVEIGAYATVGACSLVRRSVPPLATVVGIPARIVRSNRAPWRSDDARLQEIMDAFLKPAIEAPHVEYQQADEARGLAATITHPDAECFIHYSLDDSPATEDSPRYRKPLLIQYSCSVRARAYKPGYVPSQEVIVRLQPDVQTGLPQQIRAER
jgi:acetyltransferase-like isoleucine patch superfamily enzyme